jgi:predicted nucleic acid-binding protein
MPRRSTLEQHTWVIDTGVAIAAENDMSAYLRWRKALQRSGIVLGVAPVVVIEARWRSQRDPTMKVALANLKELTFSCADAHRAADLLRSIGSAANPAVGTNDPQVAVLAERNGGVLITDNPTHFNALRDAGAKITITDLPF